MHAALAATLQSLYTVCMIGLAIYGLHALWLSWQVLRQTHAVRAEPRQPDTWPLVTVQLPIYNELYVAQRIVDACARLDYPADRLEIQVLDDSDDRTSALVLQRAASWQARGVDVKVVTRADRKGFKAGALANALPLARGELIAIFDADFLPAPDFLKKTVP